MKKRITYVIISVVLLVVILTPIVSKADSGWDSDYDIGGWDSGGSWDFGGDWSSSSDWGSAGDIIILGPISLIIIIVIFIIVSKVSDAKNNDWEKDKPLITNSKFNIDYNDITQKEIDEIDSTIKIDEFKKKAFKIYKDIQEAWMNFDTDTIRKLTTDEMYNMYSSQLETLKLKHQKNIMKNIEYVDANITNITKEDGVISVVVYLRVKCLDYVINEKTKKTLTGRLIAELMFMTEQDEAVIKRNIIIVALMAIVLMAVIPGEEMVNRTFAKEEIMLTITQKETITPTEEIILTAGAAMAVRMTNLPNTTEESTAIINAPVYMKARMIRTRLESLHERKLVADAMNIVRNRTIPREQVVVLVANIRKAMTRMRNIVCLNVYNMLRRISTQTHL